MKSNMIVKRVIVSQLSTFVRYSLRDTTNIQRIYYIYILYNYMDASGNTLETGIPHHGM